MQCNTLRITFPTRSVVYPDIAPTHQSGWQQSCQVSTYWILLGIMPMKNSIDRFELIRVMEKPQYKRKTCVSTSIRSLTPCPLSVIHLHCQRWNASKVSHIGREASVSMHSLEVKHWNALAGSGAADELGWDIKMTDKLRVVSAPLENGAEPHIYKYNLPAFPLRNSEVIRGSEAGERSLVLLIYPEIFSGCWGHLNTSLPRANRHLRIQGWFLADRSNFVFQSNHDSLELIWCLHQRWPGGIWVWPIIQIVRIIQLPDLLILITIPPGMLTGTWQQIKLNHNNPFKYACIMRAPE